MAVTTFVDFGLAKLEMRASWDPTGCTLALLEVLSISVSLPTCLSLIFSPYMLLTRRLGIHICSSAISEESMTLYVQ